MVSIGGNANIGKLRTADANCVATARYPTCSMGATAATKSGPACKRARPLTFTTIDRLA
jgi:hypothetical protein